MPEFPLPEETLEVSPQFVSSLSDREAYRLIDCREVEEHEFCRIGGEVLLPLSRFADPETLLALPKEKEVPLVVYCHHGMRSAQACHYLRQKGWAQAFSLAGGIDLWSQMVDPAVPRY